MFMLLYHPTGTPHDTATDNHPRLGSLHVPGLQGANPAGGVQKQGGMRVAALTLYEFSTQQLLNKNI